MAKCERLRYGQRPWAISENQLDLFAWSLKHIPQDGLKHYCFAEKIGSIEDLADANWKLTGHYYKKHGIKMRNIEPERYERERATEVNEGYPRLTADEQAWVSLNIDN